jgi:ABC-type multidrug transport system permease subunit
MSEARHRRSIRPLVELTRARLLEFVREPEAVFWVFVFPVLLAVALGIAFRARPAESARIALLAGAPGRDRVVQLLARAPHLSVSVMDAGAAAAALHAGSIDVVLDTAAAAPLAVVYRFDPTRPEARAARAAVDDALQRAAGRSDPVAVRDEHVSEAGGRYIDFLIPGLVGLNLMGSGMWGLGFAVVQARTRKLLKRFAATPMRRSQYLLAFFFSRLAWLVLELAAVVGAGWLLFGVAVRGSLAALASIALLGAMAFAGLGLLVAARPRTIEGVSGWMNFVQLPMWLLSGTFFSYERFPAAVQPFIRALPLTALNDSLRTVINRGAPLHACAIEITVLLAWGGVSFALAIRLFRWQ